MSAFREGLARHLMQRLDVVVERGDQEVKILMANGKSWTLDPSDAVELGVALVEAATGRCSVIV